MLLYELKKSKKRASVRECVLRNQIVAFVDDRLADRDLKPGLIQAQFGIARSTLYRLAEPWGGLGELIRIRRIDKAAEVILANLDGFRDIKQIAKQHGFSTDQHFNRVFADRYGVPPQKYRVLAREQDQRRVAARSRRAEHAAEQLGAIAKQEVDRTSQLAMGIEPGDWFRRRERPFYARGRTRPRKSSASITNMTGF